MNKHDIAAIFIAMLYNNEKIPNNEGQVCVMQVGNRKQ